MEIFREYLISIGWGVAGALSMAIALPILLFVFDKFTPINEWKELEKGNMAVAVVLATLIIGFSVVVGLSILP